MAIRHAQPSEIIELPLGANLQSSSTTTLVKTDNLELIRIVLTAGKEIPTHSAPGEITVQCLEGRVAFTADGKTQELIPGALLYLAPGSAHSLKASENSSLLVTLLLVKRK